MGKRYNIYSQLEHRQSTYIGKKCTIILRSGTQHYSFCPINGEKVSNFLHLEEGTPLAMLGTPQKFDS